jgi:hypothetical protein
LLLVSPEPAARLPLLALALLVGLGTARAEVAEPEPRDEDEFSLMRELFPNHPGPGVEEKWNAYGQSTYIHSDKGPFRAPYTNQGGSPNSLLPGHESSFTGTATLYLGLRPWSGGEIQLVPELVSLRALSGLKGLGGSIQNFELQKTGSEIPNYYMSRMFIRQTWGLGGEQQTVGSNPMQLGGKQDSRRFVLTAGFLSVLDVFDKNTYAGDLRRQFTNMAFLTYAAYDFAANARGYSWGVAGEYTLDDWTFRLGRFLPPQHPNQLFINFQPMRYYGDQAEIERRYEVLSQPGAVRLLFYRNQEDMGRFSDAVAAFNSDPSQFNATACNTFSYGSSNASAPDLCWARKANVKMGAGINLEQQIRADVGVSLRAMVSDGQSEVYSYTSADRSLALGTIVRGVAWGRPRDSIGIGYAASWISQSHATYLGMGGVDGFVGDGAIKAAAEEALDVYYNWRVTNALWLTADYQHIANPGFNADRGPVDIFSGRAHLEF